MIPPGEEVELVCLGDSAHILDLDLRMAKGTRLRTTLSAISKSRDLESLKSQGVVGVKIMRGTIKPESLPVSTARMSPNLRAASRAAVHPGLPPPPQPEAPAPVPTDQTLVLKIVSSLSTEVQKLGEQLRSFERVLSEKLKPFEGMVPATKVNTEEIATAVADAVKEALKEVRFDRVVTVSTERDSRSPLDAPPDEMFIPTNIVPDGSQDIQTNKSVTETGSVDEAGAALRNARKKKDKNHG